jgi:hypothetical protein
MEHRVKILPCRKKQVEGRKAKNKKPIILENRILDLVCRINFSHHNEVGLTIPKPKFNARIKHFLWKDYSVLFSAEFSVMTSEDDVFIFYLTKSIFFHLLRRCLQKGENN